VNGAQNLLGIIDVNVAEHGKAEDAHCLLTVHEEDDAGFPLALDFRDQPLPRGLEILLLEPGL
jgi:hypothetical protein